jgi:DNA-binding MarR family transcriptional regulator
MLIRPINSLLALKAISVAPDLKASDRGVAAALIEHFNRKTGQCDPGLERMAKLLGISTRTVIRAVKRLEAAGLFRKRRHGGHLNRNSYEPVWESFQEIEAAWSTRLLTRSHSGEPKMSPATGQPCHIEGDTAVTQTYRIKNLLNETYKNGLPKEEEGRGAESHRRVSGLADTTRPRDAAETAAERRWNDALHVQFSSLPVTYGEILQAIDAEMQAAATGAEMRCRGGGLKYILNRLRIPRPSSSASSEP